MDSRFGVVHLNEQGPYYGSVGLRWFVGASSTIAPMAKVGHDSTVTYAVVVEHDCRFGDFPHLASCVSIGDALSIGSNVLVGVEAKMLRVVSIADRATVGACAVVIDDSSAGEIVVSTPFRPL